MVTGMKVSHSSEELMNLGDGGLFSLEAGDESIGVNVGYSIAFVTSPIQISSGILDDRVVAGFD